jgi:hypothetical protein
LGSDIEVFQVKLKVDSWLPSSVQECARIALVKSSSTKKLIMKRLFFKNKYVKKMKGQSSLQ